MLDGQAFCIGKTGESFQEMLPIQNGDGERPDAAMAATPAAGHLLQKGCRGSFEPARGFFGKRGKAGCRCARHNGLVFLRGHIDDEVAFG